VSTTPVVNGKDDVQPEGFSYFLRNYWVAIYTYRCTFLLKMFNLRCKQFKIAVIVDPQWQWQGGKITTSIFDT